MLVAFRITDLRGERKAAIEFILRHCILEYPKIAENIVDNWKATVIYSRSLDSAILAAQPFSTEPIYTIEGKTLVASAVNFTVETFYHDQIIRVLPSEYFYIDEGDEYMFEFYLRGQYLKLILPIDPNSGSYIFKAASYSVLITETGKDYTIKFTSTKNGLPHPFSISQSTGNFVSLLDAEGILHIKEETYLGKLYGSIIVVQNDSGKAIKVQIENAGILFTADPVLFDNIDSVGVELNSLVTSKRGENIIPWSVTAEPIWVETDAESEVLTIKVKENIQ